MLQRLRRCASAWSGACSRTSDGGTRDAETLAMRVSVICGDNHYTLQKDGSSID
jgi:hypothetical protein